MAQTSRGVGRERVGDIEGEETQVHVGVKALNSGSNMWSLENDVRIHFNEVGEA